MSRVGVQLLGERSSGTNFVESILANYNVRPHPGYLFCSKHFFHPSIFRDRSILYIMVVRNPYDWIRSLHRTPYHLLHLIDVSMKEFLTVPMKSHYALQDFDHPIPISLKREELVNPTFANIFELRKTKLRWMKEIAQTMPKTLTITYEWLLTHRDEFDQMLKDKGLTFVNDKSLDQYFKGNQLSGKFVPVPYQPFNQECLDIINHSLDWDLEAEFGYTKPIQSDSPEP